MAAIKLFVAVLLCAVCFANATVTITGLSSVLSTTSTTTVTIVGENFDSIGAGATVWIGGVPCTGAYFDDAITCTAPHGYGQNIEVKIIDGASTYSAYVADYDMATVTNGGSYGDIMVSAGASSITITITGTNFGDNSGDGTHTFTGNREVVVSGGYEATIVSHTDTDIIATLPTSGVGKQEPVRLVLGTQAIVIDDITVTFPQPVVTSVNTDSNTKRSGTWITVIFYGAGFGNPGPLVKISAWLGAFQVVSIKHISDSEIRGQVQGSGANVQPVVIVNGQSSAPSDSTYGAGSVRFDFPDSTTAGLSCNPPYGAADVFATDRCNCWSGSASSTIEGTDCSVHAACPGRVTTPGAVAESSPSRPVTSFKNDKLWIKQTVPIVKNRRDTIIQFAIPKTHANAGEVGSSTCWYPGNIWSKKVNSLDCLDEYSGVLPWSQHDLCGFVEDTASNTAQTRYFVSNLVTSYTETFKKADGTVHFRKISNAFLVTVSFTRQITALVTTPVTVIIADEKAPTSLDVTVDGDALYDVATKNTIISFVTTLAWPYQIHAQTLYATWRQANSGTTPSNDVAASAMLAAVQPGELECDQVEDTECEQSWILTINTQPGADDQVCNIAGDVVFSTMALDCRDYTSVAACQTGAGAPAPSANFTIVVGTTDLCDSNDQTVDASAGLDKKIETFYDAALTIPQNVFQTGDMVYAKVTVNDPSSTIDRVTFYNIEVSTSDNQYTDILYAVADSSATPHAQAWEYNSGAEFNKTMEINSTGMMVAPGVDGLLTFNFRLLRDELDVVGSLATDNSQDMTQQLTISATIDIWYHGNQKRSITASSSVPATAHASISFFDIANVDEELEPHNNDQFAAEDLFEFGMSSASTVVASVAAVAVAALVLA